MSSYRKVNFVTSPTEVGQMKSCWCVSSNAEGFSMRDFKSRCRTLDYCFPVRLINYLAGLNPEGYPAQSGVQKYLRCFVTNVFL